MGGCGMFRGAFVRLVHRRGTACEQCSRPRAPRDRRRAHAAIHHRGSDRRAAYRKNFLDNVPENARTLALARDWLGDTATIA